MSERHYEIFRIVTDYEALQDGFLDRIDDLNTTLSAIDGTGGFADGNAQKLLTKVGGAPKRECNKVTRYAPRKRSFGWESLGKMLKGTGLALVLVIDDERFAEVKEQLSKRARPNMPAMAGMRRTRWLFKGEKAVKMGKRRFAMMTPAERKRHQRRAAKARWAKRHRKTRRGTKSTVAPEVCTASAALQIDCLEPLESCVDGACVLA